MSAAFHLLVCLCVCRSASFAAQQVYPSGNYGRVASPNNNQNNYGNPPPQQQPRPGILPNPAFNPQPPAVSTFNDNRNYPASPNDPNVAQRAPPQSSQPMPQQPRIEHPNPMIPFFKPKARCECYIATLLSKEGNDLLDLLLPFGTSRSLTTERTDTTCRELQNQCLQHCRIQRESCLMDGLRSVVPGSTPPISYGSYACKTITKEETRKPAGIFYTLNAMYCKDEGFLDHLDDQYCCIEFNHPFVSGEHIRLFSPNCSTDLAPSCNATTQVNSGNSTMEPTTPFFDNETQSAKSSNSSIETTTSSIVGDQNVSTPSVPERNTISSTTSVGVSPNGLTTSFSGVPTLAPSMSSSLNSSSASVPSSGFSSSPSSSNTSFSDTNSPTSQTVESIIPTATLAVNGSVTTFSAGISGATTAAPPVSVS